MAIARITAWLKDPDREYAFGIQLYEQYGKSALLKALFKNGNSQYHFERLDSALKELNETLTETHQEHKAFRIPTLEEIQVPVKRYSVTDERWNELPDEIKRLYTENSKLHAHSQMLFNYARIAGSADERRKLFSSILSERNRINSNWAAIKHFSENGKVKEEIRKEEEKTVEDLSVSELFRKKTNICTYLSKDKKLADGMSDGPKKNKVLLRIQAREIQLELIKKRLEGIA